MERVSLHLRATERVNQARERTAPKLQRDRLPDIPPDHSRDVTRKEVAMSFDAARYWSERYAAGGTSGAGSYGNLRI